MTMLFGNNTESQMITQIYIYIMLHSDLKYRRIGGMYVLKIMY